MKAIVCDTYGSPDVLQLRDIDKPVMKDNQVLLRVHAAGVDRGVWHLMAGLPYLVRLMGYGLRRPKIRVPGMDVAGRVEAVGTQVTRFHPGDEVCGIGEGTFAEYAVAPENKLIPKPSNLTLEQSAALPVSGLTAVLGIRDESKVQPGQKVLIIGASGGVGSYMVQLARAAGAEVTGVGSTAKLDMIRSLGADHVIDYTHEDCVDGSRQYDVILDIGGNRGLSQLRRALTPRGKLVIVGGEDGGRWLGGTDRLLRAGLLSMFVSQQLGAQMPKERLVDLEYLKEQVEAGKVTPVIDRTFSLADAAEAIRYMEQGRVQGKVVITI